MILIGHIVQRLHPAHIHIHVSSYALVSSH